MSKYLSVNPKTFAPRLISPLIFTLPSIATSALPETCNAAKALSGLPFNVTRISLVLTNCNVPVSPAALP